MRNRDAAIVSSAINVSPARIAHMVRDSKPHKLPLSFFDNFTEYVKKAEYYWYDTAANTLVLGVMGDEGKMLSLFLTFNEVDKKSGKLYGNIIRSGAPHDVGDFADKNKYIEIK